MTAMQYAEKLIADKEQEKTIFDDEQRKDVYKRQRSFNLTRIKGDLVMKLLNNAVIRLTKNRKPAYYPENELMWDRTYNSSSWFVIGHFEAEGHKLNYLYQMCIRDRFSWEHPAFSMSLIF